MGSGLLATSLYNLKINNIKLLYFFIVLLFNGCYTVLLKPESYSNCENLCNNTWEKMILHYQEDSKGVSRNDYISYHLDFYRNGKYYYGMFELPNIPTGIYKCNNDTLKLFSNNNTEYFIVKYQSEKIELIKINDNHSMK